MTANMQQYRRDKLYLPVSSPTIPPPTYTGDYQNYKKESAFRRLVSGALRTAERHKTQPISKEQENKQQVYAAQSGDPDVSAENEKQRRRLHRKSTYSEAPRQGSSERHDSRRDDRRHSRQSTRQLELKPLSSNPVEPAPPQSTQATSDDTEAIRSMNKRRHSKHIPPRQDSKQYSSNRTYDLAQPSANPADDYDAPRKTSERHYSKQSMRRPELRQLSSNTVYNDVPRQAPANGHDYRRDGRCYSTKSMRKPELQDYDSIPATPREISNFSRPFNQDSKTNHRATVDARRPYTTERLSRASYSSRRRE